MKYEDIRRQVLTAIRQASAQGLIHGTSGNISVRDREAGVAAITPSGRPYDTMEPGDIAIVTLDGEWVDGPYAPSSETPMHTAVYRARPDVGAVVHNHALFCTVMAMAVDELPPSTPPQAEFAPIRVVPFAVPGSRALAASVTAALGTDGLAVLLRNHGSLCCGRDLPAAMNAAAYVEEAAQVAYYASALGRFTPLGEADIRACKEMLAAGRAEGLSFTVASAYRSTDSQRQLFDEDVEARVSEGMTEDEAREETARWTMPPGCSEHETGLAVDIVATDNQRLDDTQEQTPETIWLHENCWRFGFILRYPAGKEDVTGIDYESWHYRYVGIEAARYLTEQQLTLDEFWAS